MILSDNAKALVQTIQNDVDQLEKDMIAWLKSRKIRSKNIPSHYNHLIDPIQEALSQLLHPGIEISAIGPAIQTISNKAEGFYYLFEMIESAQDTKLPEAVFSLKDKIYKNACSLQAWFEGLSNV